MEFKDYFEERKLRKLNQRSADINRKVEDSKVDIHTMQKQIDYLMLVTTALTEILTEMGISKESILKKITEIDARDGVVDGKIKKTTTKCPNCKRPVAQTRSTCLYCGTAIEKSNLF